MSGITHKSLQGYLKRQSKEELIKQISETYAKFDLVKDYYQGKINPKANYLLTIRLKKWKKNGKNL